MASLSTPTVIPSITERLASSWHLFKVAFGVVRSEPALIGLTLLSLLASAAIFVALALAVGALVIPATVERLLAGALAGVDGVIFTTFLTIFSVVYGIVISAPLKAFFGGAIAYAAMERIEGRDPSIGSSMGKALSRVGALFVFGVANGIVHTLTSVSVSSGDRPTIVDQAANAAKAAAAALYALLTSLALPAIMREKIGGSAAIGRSTSIIRAVWPQATAAGIGIGTITGIVSFLAFLPLVIAFFVTFFGAANGVINPDGSQQIDTDALLAALPGLIPMAAICIPAALLISAFGNLLQAVFNGALYLYATTGKAGAFDPKDIAAAAVTTDGVVRPGAAQTT